MAPDVEKRTVSSAHVPDLDGDRFAVQEHRQYWGRRRQIAKGKTALSHAVGNRRGQGSFRNPEVIAQHVQNGTCLMRLKMRAEEAEMTDKPNYRVNRRDVKITERVAMAAVGQSILRSQKVHGTDTSLMFAERAPGYHTSSHKHDCEQMNYIVSGEIFFFVDGRGNRCKAGDIMRIPRNKVHWAWNRGTETAVVFESHSPPLRDRGGDAVALLGPDDDAAKIQHMSNLLVKMDQAEIDRIEARGIAEEEGQQAAE
jgi:mannose-6-phosphate isomerase-like protein (cupin superfamily)